ncbi:MAG: hypothetical protein PHU62_09590 [Bacteroidales bacterium]|jgi:tetratricopeptide (TPR) repeat protein|nr:hypothetical protein [Bacteroidales bacterium]MDD2205548.1 hypothetical protein [Bacteroidales bacterium]MDD3151698.1 hypothetical protein [Bacteroidales bacterium]MDD3914222.1 hypothetical protein [Bacteroidales bacterium]MDD4634801.1 hypothetical protein [Bacteroidales bacterium]
MQNVDIISDNEEINKEIEELSSLIDTKPSAILFIKRGDLLKKIHEFGKALGNYKSALKLDPDSTIAATKVEMTENILSIENTFYYENAYTDEFLFPEL